MTTLTSKRQLLSLLQRFIRSRQVIQKSMGLLSFFRDCYRMGMPLWWPMLQQLCMKYQKLLENNYIKTNKETIGKLLNALNETNEWGKVYILESIINYKPKAHKEAEEIIERISPFLQHANPAVVLGSVQNILHFIDHITEETSKDVLLKKLSAPLITLLSSEPEIQYVSL